MSEEQADEPRSSRTASTLEQMGWHVLKALEIFCVCLRYGVTYGAALGGIYGAIFGILFLLIGPAGGLVFGAFVGALCGAVGGIIFGIVGSVIPGRAGWILAGLLGGVVFPVWNWHFSAAEYRWHPFVIVVSVTSVLLGGFLGHVVNQELRGGNSSIPGVQLLAEVILDRDEIPEGLDAEAETDEGRSPP
jgi:hypothetical protein